MVIAIVIILGLLIGSALNAIIWRLKVHRSWVQGRSVCPKCEHELAALDLIPVFSWLFLKGRCRYCKKPISWQYPVVELLTAALFGLSVWTLSPVGWRMWMEVGLWLLILCVLIVLAVYDLRWMLLPDVLTFPLMVLALALLGVELAFGLPSQGLSGPLLAAILAAGWFWGLAMITRGRGMGGGDIKLVAAMGLLLGLQKTVVALVLAFGAASIVGLVLIGLKLRSRRDPIPFGPFLITATITAYLYGGPIIRWYLRLSGS